MACAFYVQKRSPGLSPTTSQKASARIQDLAWSVGGAGDRHSGPDAPRRRGNAEALVCRLGCYRRVSIVGIGVCSRACRASPNKQVAPKDHLPATHG